MLYIYIYIFLYIILDKTLSARKLFYFASQKEFLD